MNNKSVEKCSYSFWEWKSIVYSTSKYSTKKWLGLFTENGKKFVKLEANCMIFTAFVVVIIAVPITLFFHSFFNLDNASALVGSAFTILWFFSLICVLFYLNYLLLPGIGGYAYELNYINKNELRVIQNHRIPYSFFLVPQQVSKTFLKRGID